MSPFGLKFSQMILHTETSKLIYNWSFLFVVLHKPTLLPSTFKWIAELCSVQLLCHNEFTLPYSANSMKEVASVLCDKVNPIGMAQHVIVFHFDTKMAANDCRRW